MATVIEFTCSECGEDFSEPVQKFVDEPGETIQAPALCVGCGCYDADDDPPGNPNRDDSDPDYMR